MEQEQATTPQAPAQAPVQQATSSSGEVDYEKLSDTAVGDKKKYERENLNGKTVKVLKAQLFNANTADQSTLVTAMNDPSKKYWKCTFILTYDCKNKDEVNHREYLSGAIQFVQQDGSLSEHSLWYDGATNQVAELWEKAAAFKGVEPKALSTREFMGFLNSGVHVELEDRKIIYQKKEHHKNLVKQFVNAPAPSPTQ